MQLFHKKRVLAAFRNGNAAFGQHGFGAALHIPGTPFGFVVIAEQVQEAVDGKQGDFAFQRPAGSLGLTAGGRDGNDDIAEHLRVILGERENIGRLIFSPVF